MLQSAATTDLASSSIRTEQIQVCARAQGLHQYAIHDDQFALFELLHVVNSRVTLLCAVFAAADQDVLFGRRRRCACNAAAAWGVLGAAVCVSRPADTERAEGHEPRCRGGPDAGSARLLG